MCKIVLRGKKKAVIAAYIEHCTVTHACRAAKVAPASWYEWKHNDPDFLAATVAAAEAVADRMEKVMIRRATEGSDTLLIFLMKGLRPEKYKDRVYNETKHTGLDELLKAIQPTLGPPSARTSQEK
jgi:hypothetical protein